MTTYIANFRWAAALATLIAVPGAAQQACRFADLGVSSLECRDCHIQVSDDVIQSFRTGTELRLNRIRPNGPTAGVLRDGDVLVAINGAPITTAEGGRRFAALAPGRAATLTIRREGLNRDVRVVPGAQCHASLGGPPPPRPPRPPRPAQAPRPPRVESIELHDVEVIDAPPAPPAPPRPAPTPRVAPAPRVPPTPPTPPTPATPPSPPDFLPGGWFGFGIGCENCEIRQERGRNRFTFRSLPRVESVEPGSPASRAGLQRGDRLTHIDGLALTTAPAWRRFGSVAPGQRVRWSFTRNGRQQTAEILATRRPDARVSTARPSSPAASQRLRYSGAVGGADVEVRGAPVTVTRDPRTGETVIRSRDLTVRIRPDN